MKTKYKVAMALLAGVLIGVAGARAIHAQQAKTPPGYVIAEVEITDPAALKQYAAQAPQIVASHGGHYVVRGGDVQALEGEPPKGFIVVIGFDSAKKAREWYDSPEYSAIRSIRQGATKSRIFIVEGEPQR
ncbi:MAG: DUF1330 domain-containing protein [Candidatus Sulfotelmatobacter sp.]